MSKQNLTNTWAKSPIRAIQIDPQNKPANFSAASNTTTEVMTTSNHKLPFLWKQLQKLYEKDQCYLKFSGFAIDLVQVHQKRIIF